MCTRYLLLQQHYRAVLRRLGVRPPEDFVSRYNIAPGRPIPAIRLTPGGGARAAAALRWGLVPAWAKDASAGARLINARAASLAEKPSFRDALRERRCVIPASGFYEWEVADAHRLPWLFTRRDGQPFGLAGLWESWRGPAGEVLETCAVVTTEPNEVVRPIHHRMPVAFTPEECEQWLAPGPLAAGVVARLLRPLAAADLTARRVGCRVNQVGNEGEDCLAPPEPGGDEPPRQLPLEL